MKEPGRQSQRLWETGFRYTTNAVFRALADSVNVIRSNDNQDEAVDGRQSLALATANLWSQKFTSWGSQGNCYKFNLDQSSTARFTVHYSRNGEIIKEWGTLNLQYSRGGGTGDPVIERAFPIHSCRTSLWNNNNNIRGKLRIFCVCVVRWSSIIWLFASLGPFSSQNGGHKKWKWCNHAVRTSTPFLRVL